MNRVIVLAEDFSCIRINVRVTEWHLLCADKLMKALESARCFRGVL